MLAYDIEYAQKPARALFRTHKGHTIFVLLRENLPAVCTIYNREFAVEQEEVVERLIRTDTHVKHIVELCEIPFIRPPKIAGICEHCQENFVESIARGLDFKHAYIAN